MCEQTKIYRTERRLKGDHKKKCEGYKSLGLGLDTISRWKRIKCSRLISKV